MSTSFGRRVLEQMNQLQGYDITVDEMIEEAERSKRLTRKQADECIQSFRKGPDVHVLDGDDGPVNVTREKMIQRIDALVEVVV